MTYLHSILTLSPLKVSAGYLIFGVIWIPTTDLILAIGFESQQMPTILGLVKGWTFIGISALLIFALSQIHHQQMETTQTKLETANQQLQVLHRVFRHNIRNDLNIVLGYADILSNQVSKQKSETYIETIQQKTEKIISVSNKLKIVEDVDPTLSDENVVDLVKLVVDEIERLCDENPDVTIKTELPDNACVQADESLQYAIREVLENAVIHNDNPDPDCCLSISIERSNSEILLIISDNGPGIPQAELRPFEIEQETPLVHASSVGLWLTTWLTRIHGGSIEFNIEDGTTVSFQLQSDPHMRLLNSNSSWADRVRTTVG